MMDGEINVKIMSIDRNNSDINAHDINYTMGRMKHPVFLEDINSNKHWVLVDTDAVCSEALLPAATLYEICNAIQTEVSSEYKDYLMAEGSLRLVLTDIIPDIAITVEARDEDMYFTCYDLERYDTGIHIINEMTPNIVYHLLSI